MKIVRLAAATLMGVCCFGQLDPGILNSIAHPPAPPNVLDNALKAQQIRNLQLQNQQRQQQLDEARAEERRRQSAVPAAASAPPVRAPVGDRASDMKTRGYSNGRLWLASDRGARIGYLAGIQELISFGARDLALTYLPSGSMTVVEMGAALDLFYSDPVNLPIPVIQGLAVIIQREHGADPAETEKLAASYRRDALGAPAPAPAQ